MRHRVDEAAHGGTSPNLHGSYEIQPVPIKHGNCELQSSSTSVLKSPAPETIYSFKPSLIASAHEFALTEEGLSWRGSGKSGLWPYREITAIRLSYRPVSMQSRRFRADLTNVRNEHQTIYSTTWHTAALMTSQGDSYKRFITELHHRIAEANGQPILTGGIHRGIFITGAILMALVLIAMAGLVVRALAVGEFAGALFLLGFAALFVWQIGRFMQRNRPRAYSLTSLPVQLMP